jgi:universal stress protein A
VARTKGAKKRGAGSTLRRFRRILHPTDFSRASAGALATALGMARDLGAELIVLHVVDQTIPIPSEGYIPPRMYDEVRASALGWARKNLDRLVARATAARVRARAVVAEGVAHDQIVRVARTARADLLVMGTHGRTGLTRLFLGSVAGRVISTAACPVLTVRSR